MKSVDPALRGAGLRVAIVWSRFNEEIVRELVTACDRQLVELGVAPEDIHAVSVPGALEIPLALQTLALERRGFTARRYDALVALCPSSPPARACACSWRPAFRWPTACSR